MIKSSVWVSFRFEGFHRWPEAPPEVAFLRTRHRHVFHVKAWKSVKHDDRDVEFILLKREVEGFCQARSQYEKEHGPNDITNWSCEKWARTLIEEFYLDGCEVSEDGENGALLWQEDEPIAAPPPVPKVVSAAPPHVLVEVGDATVCVCGEVFEGREAADAHMEAKS